jgi:glycerophosphoryl diester phosphodiesterase
VVGIAEIVIKEKPRFLSIKNYPKRNFRMDRWLMGRGFLILLAGPIIMSFITGTILFLSAKPAPDHPFFNPDRFLVIAHRGGRRLGPENTLYTFQRAVDLGVDVLEMDVHGTKDGHLVILHDDTLDRTTEATGAVADKTLAEIKKLDAAFRWSEDNGCTYPLRHQTVKIPTLKEVFRAFPDTRMNLEIKDSRPQVSFALCRLIRDCHMSEKVMVASFDADRLKKFRSLCPEVATSAGTSETTVFYLLQRVHLESVYSPNAQALQVPEKYRATQVVGQRFLEAAHARNMRVHVWTVNDADSMEQLLKLGVDGIMTDDPQRLLEISERFHRMKTGRNRS